MVSDKQNCLIAIVKRNLREMQFENGGLKEILQQS